MTQLRYILFIVLLNFASFLQAQSTVLRAAIDIGSGGAKLRVAEVDKDANALIKVVHVQQFPVLFQDELSTSKTLSPTIMAEGILAIQKAIQTACAFNIDGVVLIGTSPFRLAMNSDEFAQDIQQKTGYTVHVIDQKLEAKLAFQAALGATRLNEKSVVVIDVGGGSTQLISKSSNGLFHIHLSQNGSGPFRDHIIASIQKRNLKETSTPNPISRRDAQKAELYAQTCASKIDKYIRCTLGLRTTTVVGVGNVFRGIAAQLQEKNSCTLSNLSSFVQNAIGKSDAQLGNNQFSKVELSNAIFVLGYMKKLNIKHIQIVDVNNADGALTYIPFWR